MVALRLFLLKMHWSFNMTLDEYQKEATQFAIYESKEYPFFALAEEVGEFIGVIAKEYRGDYDRYDNEQLTAVVEKLRKEAGDVLWQFANALAEIDMSLEEVAVGNLEKLRDRKERGTIKGNGDDR